MKKIIVFIGIIVLFFFSLLHDNDLGKHTETMKTTTNTISEVSLTDNEYALLKSTGYSQSFIFSINHNGKVINKVNYWIDHYSKGVMTKVLSASSPIQSTNEIRIYLNNMEVDSSHELWILSEKYGGNSTTSKTLSPKEAFAVSMAQSILEGNQSLEIGKEYDLASIVRNKNQNIMSVTNKLAETIKNNDDVYIFRCNFE
jgi:hypothetical protein